MSKKQKKQLNKFFPGKLMAMLDAVEGLGLSHGASWISDGRAFAIHDVKVCMEEIFPKFFDKLSHLRSFHRQLSIWGFTRLESGAGGKGVWIHKHFARDSPDRIYLIKRVPVKNPKPGKSPPSTSIPRSGRPARRGEEDYARYVLPERIRDLSGDVGTREDGASFAVPAGGPTGRHPTMGGAGAGMMQGWDERVQMNMMNHMMAMQNSMNVMAMNLMTQQRAFGNNGGANGNPQAPQLMGMGGAMPAFNGQHMPMNQSSVQGLLAQIDSESLQAALLARAIMENRRQDASGAGPGQAQPSGAQNVGATSVQDRAVDGGPVECQKPSQAIDQSIDDQKLHSDRQRMSPEKDS